MNDVLNLDMIDAIDAVDITDNEKALIREILFIERGKKDIVWDTGNATDEYNKILIHAVDDGDENDIVL